MVVEIVHKRRKYHISWSNGYIPATGDERDQESYQGCSGQRSTYTNKSWPQNLTSLQTSASLIRYGGYHQRWTTPQEHGRSQKNTTEWFNRRIVKCSASSYQTKRKHKKKTRSKKENKANEEIGKLEKWMMEKEMKKTREAMEMKLMMGTSQTQIAIKTATSLSRTILMKKLIAAEIEDEALDCIHEKKHRRSHGTDENSNNPMLDQNSQQNVMEISDENRIVTGRKMGSESSRMEPWTQHEIQNLQSCGKTKTKRWRRRD